MGKQELQEKIKADSDIRIEGLIQANKLKLHDKFFSILEGMVIIADRKKEAIVIDIKMFNTILNTARKVL